MNNKSEIGNNKILILYNIEFHVNKIEIKSRLTLKRGLPYIYGMR